MKAKAVAYILFFWIFCFNVMAQDKDKGSIMEEVISLPFSSATISACFSLIKKKDIILSYNEGMIDINKICYFSQKNIKIKELLTNILSDYKTTIVVANPRKIIITVDRKNIYQLNGVVRETETLEKLYGAVLFFKKNGIIVSSCITNDSGFFSTALPEGTYNIETNYLGYLKSVKIVTLICNQRIDIFLKPMMLELGEVVISPQRSSANELSTSSPPNMLSYSNLDVLSEMKVFPGVIMSRSGADINVNGGGSEENLILLDGVPIYHNSHINYMLPVFNGSVIKNVNLYSSYFPARYEGKLSSILDIKIKEGNKKKHSRSLSLDIPSVAAMLEGPIKKEKASYMVSGRRSWMEFLDKAIPASKRANYTFYDIYTKLHWDISAKTSMQISTYHTIDEYYSPIPEGKKDKIIHWANGMYALKLSCQLGEKLFNTTQVAYTHYTNKAHADILGFEADPYVTAGIKEVSFNSSFNCHFNNKVLMAYGIKGTHSVFSNINDDQRTEKSDINQISAYYENKFSLSSKWNIQIGINTVIYMPKGGKHYSNLQPRFSMAYNWGRDVVSLDISRMAQFYHYFRFYGMDFPTDLRMPSINQFKPQTSVHTELGWKHYLNGGYTNASIYYKQRDKILFVNPEAYYSSENWKNFLLEGRGESYGLKLSFFKGWEKISVQAAYTWSKSLESYTGFRKGHNIPSLYDIPHVFNSTISYRLTEASAFSIGTQLHSGRVIVNIPKEPLASMDELYTKRYPFSYKFDIGYTYVKYFPRSGNKLTLRLGIHNIFGNPIKEEISNFYKVNLGQDCIPYGGIILSF